MSDSAIHSAAGALGGIVAMTATYPLIFLSTRAAVETKNENKSTKQAVVDILSREGFLGLYDGLKSSLLGIAVTNGVYYYFYERTKAGIVSRRAGSKGLSTLESIIAGLIAGSATTIISNPIWVIQTSQAVQSMTPAPSSDNLSEKPVKPVTVRKRGFVETIQYILQTGGIEAFWRGIGPALVLVVNPVLQYTVFEQLKNALVRRRKARGSAGALTDLDFFILGALSKLVATGATYPYIVVKSRLQAGHEHAKRYKSAFHGLQTIIAEEGVQGVYKGISNKLIQSVLTAAILFAGQRRIFEMTKAALAPVVSKA